MSTGEAMKEMEKMAAQLPAGIGYEWTGLSYEEKKAGAQAPALYAISLLVVFLCRGGPVRELDHPLRQPADAAAGPGRRGDGGQRCACSPTTSISRSAC